MEIHKCKYNQLTAFEILMKLHKYLAQNINRDDASKIIQICPLTHTLDYTYSAECKKLGMQIQWFVDAERECTTPDHSWLQKRRCELVFYHQNPFLPGRAETAARNSVD